MQHQGRKVGSDQAVGETQENSDCPTGAAAGQGGAEHPEKSLLD